MHPPRRDLGHDEPVTTNDSTRGSTALLVGPAGITILVFLVLPATWTLLRGATSIGWIASSQVSTLVNSAVWMLGGVVGSLLVGVLLTSLMHGRRGAGLLSGLLLVPAASSMAVAAVAWRFLFAFRPDGRSQVGLVNEIVGLGGVAPVAWLTQEPLVNTVLLACAGVWVLAGVVAAVLLAALDRAEVPAASGGWWSHLRGEMIPALRRPLVGIGAVVAVLTVRVHDLVRVATDGAFGTQVLSTEAIDRALVDGQAGRGAALGIVLLVATAPFAVALARWAARDGALAPVRAGGRHRRARRRAVAPRPPVVAAIVTGIALVPLLAVGATAFRPAADVAADGWWTLLTAPAFTAENLRTVLADGPRGGMWSATLDSLAITVPAVLLTLGLALLVHAGLARSALRWITVARPTLVVLALVPPALVLPPIARALDAIGLHGNPLGPWLVHAALGLPLVLLVLGRPGLGVRTDRLVAAATIQFVLVWNDLLVATTTIGGEDRPMPVAVRLATLVSSRGEEQHLVAAAAVVAALVPVLVVVSMRRQLVRLVSDPPEEPHPAPDAPAVSS